MTRINCIPPEELTRQHLIAEYRELPRVFGLVRKAIERGEKPDDKRNPTEYTLGKGHVRFFYPRLGYVWWRYNALIREMENRGYNPTYSGSLNILDGIPDEWIRSWKPTPTAMAINRKRISERLKNMS